MSFEIAISRYDIIDGLFNECNCIGYGLGYAAVGFGASLAVNAVAHHIFGVNKDSSRDQDRSLYIKGIAVIAGTVACFCIGTSGINLTSFSKTQAIQALFAQIMIPGVSMFIPGMKGIFLGYTGVKYLPIVALPGAIAGSVLYQIFA